MVRDARGRFVPGAPLDEDMRRRISEAQAARHRRIRLEQDQFAVTEKRCTVCRLVKRVPDDYVMRRRTLKCGEIRVYPSGECRQCGAARREKWKADYIAKHGEEAWRKKQRQHSKGRDKKKRRRYSREYGRMQRMEQGATPRGPWLKYRDEVGSIPGRREKVSSIPFQQWWRSIGPDRRREIVNGSVALDRAVRENLRPDKVNVTKYFLHQISAAADDTQLLTTLSMGRW